MRHVVSASESTGSSATSRSPVSTRSPTAKRTSPTTESDGAVILCSIFIASTTISSCPSTTLSPTATWTAITVPGSGEIGPPPPTSAWCTSNTGARSNDRAPVGLRDSTTDGGALPDGSIRTSISDRIPSTSTTWRVGVRSSRRTSTVTRSSGDSDPSSVGSGHWPEMDRRPIATVQDELDVMLVAAREVDPTLALALRAQVAPSGRGEPEHRIGAAVVLLQGEHRAEQQGDTAIGERTVQHRVRVLGRGRPSASSAARKSGSSSTLAIASMFVRTPATCDVRSARASVCAACVLVGAWAITLASSES